jgi:hypothetical protein
MFKKLDHNVLVGTWNRFKRETYYLGRRNGSMQR